ncbi:nucleotidyltransferase [Mycoplasmatota bacterium WC44]
MKAIGVIVEYNPFHNGHLHHLNTAKKLSNADCVIAVMSGNFVQRGEPAILDKWARTKLTIENGVDLVIELPYAYTIQSADTFAYGSIDILNKLDVDELYFGSETNDISLLNKTVELFNTVEFQTKIKEYLDKGNNYPSASGKAVYDLTGANFTSNDNLGVQYMTAIKKLNSRIIPKTIKRIHSNYLDMTSTHESIASATAIRSMENPKPYVPNNTYEALKQRNYNWDDYYSLLQYKIVTDNNLNDIFLVDEGIENRFKKFILSETFDEFVNQVYTRRYTRNRIRRILTNILCNVKKREIEDLQLSKGVPYIRVLGMNDTGRNYLNLIKKNSETPIISKASETKSNMMDIETKTTFIFDKSLYKNEFLPLIYKK